MSPLQEPQTAFVGLGRDERDRRWAAVRRMMAAQGFDILVVFGLKSRERIDAWLANESSEGIVVFPARGEPVYISWHFKMVSRRFTSSYAPDTFWIDDFRVGPYSAKIVEAIKEFGADRGTIGTIGVDTKEPAAIEGYAPYLTWDAVLRELPRATFRDATYALAEVMIKKSAAEIRMVRRCAQIGETACQAFLDAARPGAPEHHVLLAVTSAILSAGAAEIDPIIMTVGRDDVGWARPLSYYTSVPRYLRAGDLGRVDKFDPVTRGGDV
jgi:Xaa-Pro aminopeptidase